eukprot:356036_1
MPFSCLDLVNQRKFSELNELDCQSYLVKLHLMYYYLASASTTHPLNELKAILSRYHHNMDVILPYIQLDLHALSHQLLQMDCSQSRNKAELQLQQEFENGSPSQRVLMIYEELYHFSNGSKSKLYCGSTKFFLCRYQPYQNTIRLIVTILFYVPKLPLTPNQIMDVVLSHCKNRLEFTSYIFKNVPSSLMQPLTIQLVEYTEKQINLIRKARVSNHQKRVDSTGKQIEFMKRIFRNLASLSPWIARHIQKAIASKQICPEIYVELSISQEHSSRLFIQQLCADLIQIDTQQYLLPYLRSIRNNHPLVKTLNGYLHKTVGQYHALKAELLRTQSTDCNSKMEMDAAEDDDVEMKEDTDSGIQIQLDQIIQSLDELITIYVTFVGLAVNIEIDASAIADLLSLIESDAPYRLLSQLMIFILLCPRFLKMKRFETVCNVYDEHPILNMDYCMMIHHIMHDTYQPILDLLRDYTKVSFNITANVFHHFKELKHSFLRLNSANHIDRFFTWTKPKLLNYDRMAKHLQQMKTMNGNATLDCCELYLHKLERFLTTAQFILHRDSFTANTMKMDEWLFDVMAAACWPTPKIHAGFPNICFTLFKLMDRCAMLTSRMHLEAAMASNGKRNKVGIEAFYNYIESELKTPDGSNSIHCYSNPLQITLCIYFILLSNHRFYKSYNHYLLNGSAANNGNHNTESFMSDGSSPDIVMSSNEDPSLPATQMYKVNSLHTPTHPPFPVEMLYGLPVTACIEYLRSQTDNAKGKELIDKSIEKCIYLIRHHYPHWLYWLDLNALLVSPKFKFLQYGLNLDLMKDTLYFNTSHVVDDMRTIHESFIKDFVDHSDDWTTGVSFEVPSCFMTLITSKDVVPCRDIPLLPASVSAKDVSDILVAMAAAFEHNDLVHHKWQYIFGYWWQKYAMRLPLSFMCLSLQSFVTNPSVNNIRLVLQNPNILLAIDEKKYPKIWSNVWFLNMFIRIIHVLLSASQEHIISCQPNIYSTLANESMRNTEKIKDEGGCQQLRSLILLNEMNVLESIMKRVEECSNASKHTMQIVIELILWRHCQSLSQGNCYESSVTRRQRSDTNLKASFDNKNFKLFGSFVAKYHDKFGFDIISLLLSRTVSYGFVGVLIEQLVAQHNHNWNVLQQYQPIMMKHFESFSKQVLLSGNAPKDCVSYFESISAVHQPWLFALIFVVEAVALTDDDIWMHSFKYIVDNLRDIMHQCVVATQSGMTCKIENAQIRDTLCGVLNELWRKVKDTKYLMDGFVLKQFSLTLANHGKSEMKGWPYIDTKSNDI